MRVEEFDGFVAGAGEKLLILCPGEAFDDAFMGLRAEYLFSARQVPDLDYTIATAACEPLQGLWVPDHCIDSIDMAFS